MSEFTKTYSEELAKLRNEQPCECGMCTSHWEAFLGFTPTVGYYEATRAFFEAGMDPHTLQMYPGVAALGSPKLFTEVFEVVEVLKATPGVLGVEDFRVGFLYRGAAVIGAALVDNCLVYVAGENKRPARVYVSHDKNTCVTHLPHPNLTPQKVEAYWENEYLQKVLVPCPLTLQCGGVLVYERTGRPVVNVRELPPEIRTVESISKGSMSLVSEADFEGGNGYRSRLLTLTLAEGKRSNDNKLPSTETPNTPHVGEPIAQQAGRRVVAIGVNGGHPYEWLSPEEDPVVVEAPVQRAQEAAGGSYGVAEPRPIVADANYQFHSALNDPGFPAAGEDPELDQHEPLYIEEEPEEDDDFEEPEAHYIALSIPTVGQEKYSSRNSSVGIGTKIRGLPPALRTYVALDTKNPIDQAFTEVGGVRFWNSEVLIYDVGVVDKMGECYAVVLNPRNPTEWGSNLVRIPRRKIPQMNGEATPDPKKPPLLAGSNLVALLRGYTTLVTPKKVLERNALSLWKLFIVLQSPKKLGLGHLLGMEDFLNVAQLIRHSKPMERVITPNPNLVQEKTQEAYMWTTLDARAAWNNLRCVKSRGDRKSSIPMLLVASGPPIEGVNYATDISGERVPYLDISRSQALSKQSLKVFGACALRMF